MAPFNHHLEKKHKKMSQPSPLLIGSAALLGVSGLVNGLLFMKNGELQKKLEQSTSTTMKHDASSYGKLFIICFVCYLNDHMFIRILSNIYSSPYVFYFRIFIHQHGELSG